MSKITESARGERCMIQIREICRQRTDTVVFCHSNEEIHGTGVGLKSREIFGAYGCQDCHDVYDRRRPAPGGMSKAEIREYFHNGNARTVHILIEKGLIKCL